MEADKTSVHQCMHVRARSALLYRCPVFSSGSSISVALFPALRLRLGSKQVLNRLSIVQRPRDRV